VAKKNLTNYQLRKSIAKLKPVFIRANPWLTKRPGFHPFLSVQIRGLLSAQDFIRFYPCKSVAKKNLINYQPRKSVAKGINIKK